VGVSTTLSCAQCGATLRPDQGWCSLCYAQVEAHFDPLTAPLEELEQRESVGSVQPDEQVGQALETIDESQSTDFSEPLAPTPITEPAPKPAFTSAEPVSTVAETSTGAGLDDVDVMLSMLAAEHRQNDRSAALAERMSDRGVRMAVMFGGMLLVGALAFFGLTALGLIF
jgi:predicted amidophosphoribosyltransferase